MTDLRLTDEYARQCIADGATPKAIEEAIMFYESQDLSARTGIPVPTLAALRNRWGITRREAIGARGAP